MPTKALASPEWQADSDSSGAFQATFATLGVIDRDFDVTVPGAFKDGQRVKIASWGHNWGTLPVGDGVIHADARRAWVDGRFFLDTTPGADTYKTVKRLADLQEWSYGFEVTEWSVGEQDGRQVRFLRGLNVFEVSPVMVGAGIGTRTDDIKSADLEGKPLAGSHACRLKEPSAFQDGSFRTMSRRHEGKPYGVVVGRLKGETSMTEQSYRYKTDDGWTEAQARSHCSDHDGILFEPAKEKSAGGSWTEPMAFASHIEHVLAGVQSVAERGESLAGLRAEGGKEGRRLSEATRALLRRVLESRDAMAEAYAVLEDLIATTQPPEKGGELRALYADYLRTTARLNGVAV